MEGVVVNIPRGLGPAAKFGGRQMAGTVWNYSNQVFLSVSYISAVSGTFSPQYMIPFMQPFDQNTGAPVTYGAGFSTSDRWQVVRRAWQQFAVTGVMFEYHPRYLMPVGTQPNVYGASFTTSLSASQADLANSTDLQLAAGMGNQRLNPQQPFTKYISFKKIAAEMQAPWQDTVINTAIPIEKWPSRTNALFRMESTGDYPVQGEVIGLVKV